VKVLWLVPRGSSRSFITEWQKIIYIHSLGRACRYYTQRCRRGARPELATLAANGFEETD